MNFAFQAPCWHSKFAFPLRFRSDRAISQWIHILSPRAIFQLRTRGAPAGPRGRSTHTPNVFPQRRQSDAERNGAKFQFSIKPVPNENENISPRRPPGTLGRVSRTKFDPNNPNPLRSEVVPNFVSRPRSFLIHQIFVYTQTPDRPPHGAATRIKAPK